MCEAPGWHAPRHKSERLPLISPFELEKLIINGSSAGLSSASYDIRIGYDLTLGPNPMAVFEQMMKASNTGLQAIEHAQELIKVRPSYRSLAHSLETFAIPDDVVAYVVDKSTYARRFMSAFNTLFDPGFVGTATLELVNLGSETIIIEAGDPICQVAFHFLDQPTDRPYSGKYSHQPARAVGARSERADGTFIEAGVYPEA
jgi:dCTP deaminase